MDVLDAMSKDLFLSKEAILRMAYSPYDYKLYYTKKHGRPRKIAHPSKDLKLLQHWLVKHLFNTLPVSEYCVAYEKGCSIQGNALIHHKNNFIFHTDISKFFESITRKHIIDLLSLYYPDISSSDIELICKIVLYKGHLVVGSVASPSISNRIMYNFDLKLFEELQKIQKCIYTRYADDIIISSKTFIYGEIIEIIDSNLKELYLERNASKTFFSSKSKKRQVTGIVIDNNDSSLSVGSKYLLELKKQIYLFLVYDKGDINAIKGKLSFVKNTNPDQYERLISKYIKYKNGEKLEPVHINK